MRTFTVCCSLILLAGGCAEAPPPKPITLTLVDQHPRPVVAKGMPGTQDNKYGFEGGRVILHNGAYHLFVSEMIADVKWAKTRLAHWTSTDKVNWRRVSTIRESSGDHTGQDPKAALFLPIPMYDDRLQRWTLFYSAFKSAPNGSGKWLLNHEGRIWRAVSDMPGPDGLAGPYTDQGVILQPGQDSDPWEGLQGVDSFFPFQIDGAWHAFYGSAQTQKWPCEFWGVGLAKAPKLSGPWKRLSQRNPVLIDKRWVENLHVLKLPAGPYIAVFDATPQGRAIGYTSSPNGLTWAPAQYIPLDSGENNWLKQPRTPISLLLRHDGLIDVFFTGYDRSGYGCLSFLTVRVD